MPWHWKGETLVCTGPCNSTGWVPCPVNHDTAPDNDEWGGVPFFRCDECDWVRPDDFGENTSEFAGKVRCPECGEGEREDTYDGPCDLCSKKNRVASDRTFPEPLHELARKKFRRIRLWSCPQCFHTSMQELEAAHRETAERQAWRVHHGHKPAGTCDNCGEIDYLDVAGPDWYICARCSPTWTPPIPQQREPEPDPVPQIEPESAEQEYTGSRRAPDDPDGPTPGWYDDPEHDGYLRWWSGTEWAGPPTLPEHCTT